MLEPQQEQAAARHHPPNQQQQDIGSPESTDQDATNPASSANNNKILDPGSPPKQQQLAGGGYSAVGEWKIVLNTRWSLNRRSDNNNSFICLRDWRLWCVFKAMRLHEKEHLLKDACTLPERETEKSVSLFPCPRGISSLIRHLEVQSRPISGRPALCQGICPPLHWAACYARVESLHVQRIYPLSPTPR